MAIKERKGYWHLDIKIPGKERVRRTTGIRIEEPRSRLRAQESHDKLKAELYEKNASGSTLDDALILWMKIKPRSSRERSALKVFMNLFPDRPLSEIRGTDLHDALLNKKPATANRTLNILRAAINLAHERGLCDEIKIPKRSVTTSRTRHLTREEWQRISKKLPPHVLHMATFALATGLRLSNVTGMRWKNIDLKTCTAWIEPDEAKGRKVIPVPLSVDAIKILNGQHGKHPDFVFTYRGRPIKSVKKAWKRALVEADIDVIEQISKSGPNKGKPYLTSTFRWHDLRHTWASWHIQEGTPLAALQELGGWKSMEMVMRYAHLAPEHLRLHVNAVSKNLISDEEKD